MEHGDRIYDAVILNEPYLEWVKRRKKTIETRMRRLNLSGDTIFCCDKGRSAGSKNAGKAVCMAFVEPCRPMTDEDMEAACIENVPGRMAFPLSNLRHFSYDFNFIDYAITKNWQGVFKLKIPEFVTIFPAGYEHGLAL